MPKIIHLSDLHFTNSEHTLDNTPDTNFRDTPDREGRLNLIKYTIDNKDTLRADTVVITGDLTDSGCAEDYTLARSQIELLAKAGYTVHCIPGNHDYCFEGLLLFEKIFAAVNNAVGSANAANMISNLMSGGVLGLIEWAGKKSEILQGAQGLVRDAIATIVRQFTHAGDAPRDLIDAILSLFEIDVEGDWWNPLSIKLVVKGLPDTVSNATRQRRFAQLAGYSSVNDFPYARTLGDCGQLILLDSMQGQMKSASFDGFSQGRLGADQIAKCKSLIDTYQTERAAGKKLFVCLHHSPFHVKTSDRFNPNLEIDKDWKIKDSGVLTDAVPFLKVLEKDGDGKYRIDGLLYGHTTPANCYHLPLEPDSLEKPVGKNEIAEHFSWYQDRYAPLISCVNLEHARADPKSGFPIVTIDVASLRREVRYYKGGGSDHPPSQPEECIPGEIEHGVQGGKPMVRECTIDKRWGPWRHDLP